MVVIDTGSSDLGKFTLLEGIELSTVNVVATKPLVKAEINKLIYDVENDPDAAKSNTLEILNKIPFIQVDKMTNKIKIMGQEAGFSIIVNGKKSLLISETNQYVAKMLQAGQLKQIELITSPDGKYSDQTAVINIITKSSLPDGLVGEVSIYGSDLVRISSGFQLTSKIGNLIYNTSYNYGYSNLYGTMSNSKTVDYRNDEFRFSESYIRNSPGSSNSHNAGIRASYDISDQDMVAVNFKVAFDDGISNINSFSKYQNSSNIITREFIINSSNVIYNAQYVGSVDYQRSFKSKPNKQFTATYSLDNRKNEMKYDRITESITGYTDNRDQTLNNLNNFEQTAAIDFYNTIAKNQSYYITAKYVHRRYTSDIWLSEMNNTPVFTTQVDALEYLQQVGSLLCNYSIRTNKVMATGQIAFEHTDNDINFGINNSMLKKSDDALLANLRFNYQPSNRSMFVLSLSREYFRPDIGYLNPYEDKSIAGQIYKGNPELDNQKSYFTMLMFRYFVRKSLNIRALASMRYSNNAVQQYSFVNNNGVLITTYGNISRESTMNFSIGINYNPSSWLEINLNGRMALKSFEYPGNKNSYWDPMFMLSFTSELWHGANLRTQLLYITQNWDSNLNIQSSKQHMRVDGLFDFSQKIGRRLRLGVFIQNPWQTYKNQIIEQASSDFYKKSETRSLGRTIGFQLTYNFGQFKDSVKAAKRAVRNTDRTKSENL
ncbi:MAG: hypothetical protein A2X19_03185 [Bacteroidetes bacterium GWE2_39_28]|nr:MAG: hypothetical protein A2X19_03185 [Bacteroidetes bacterium GWE2_39_28]OFY15588.1 MAG: hypothetical protein A2X16_04485 [Bacteroidetes bacterium GWF2_39_10]OFZ08266.1 MAG: hypothetical protein A2322_06095 [Bacteroidetes bacterium RIFOXYB2_FULL_39_7]HCT94147.1 hypothetical protein [Rikenellaceae bacterium]